ncbi:MAG: hypothetical protein IJ542_03320 [Clostridia bacterium]|nr:hypothetical protein [Clostridia bacterium]
MNSYKLDIKLKDSLSFWLKEHKREIVLCLISMLIGIVVGVIISFGDVNLYKLLTTGNENLYAFISGTAELNVIFWQRLFVGLFGAALIIIFSLSFYSSFLGFAYLSYQTAVFVLAIVAIIEYYSLGEIIFCVVMLIPTNLLLLSCLGLLQANCHKRAKDVHHFQMQFTKSFTKEFWISTAILVIFYLLVQILINLFVPMILRAIYVINY